MDRAESGHTAVHSDAARTQNLITRAIVMDVAKDRAVRVLSENRIPTYF